MTREEAISLLSQVNHILVNSNSWLENTHELLNMAFDMAIKALEQEPILDKIRTEIKEWYWQADKQALAKDPCVVDAMIDLFIRTIDKYKAESEDKG